MWNCRYHGHLLQFHRLTERDSQIDEWLLEHCAQDSHITQAVTRTELPQINISVNEKMIASVVARLIADPAKSQAVLDAIKLRPEMEIGELTRGHLLPVTIEADDGELMEQATQWLNSLEDVLFVDVVFVHFEDHEPQSKLSLNQEM